MMREGCHCAWETGGRAEEGGLLERGFLVVVWPASSALSLFGVKCLGPAGGDPSTLPSSGVSGGRGLRMSQQRAPIAQDGEGPSAPGRASTGPSVCGPRALAGPPP